MLAPVLPEEVKTFLQDVVDSSFDNLEVLRLLWSHADSAWSPRTVAAELGTTESLAEEVLQTLCRRRLVVAVAGDGPPQFAYRPQTRELRELVTKGMLTYQERRIDVVTALTSGALSRMQRTLSALSLVLARASLRRAARKASTS
jgi:hypothetical protein